MMIIKTRMIMTVVQDYNDDYVNKKWLTMQMKIMIMNRYNT